MLPKNSRRPLTLDHKIRLKKQLAKAYKVTGYSQEDTTPANKKIHQDFKPRPTDKIIRQRNSQEEERIKAQEEKDLQIKARQEERVKSISRRREQNRKLSTKNRRGQPNLNNQIDALLGKISK